MKTGGQHEWTDASPLETEEVLKVVDCQERFSDYFWEPMNSWGITGGYMKFEFVDGRAIVRTIYDIAEKLTTEQEKALINYTQGQWSDGIGEGFEQQEWFIDSHETIQFFLSPWFRGQKAELEYRD